MNQFKDAKGGLWVMPAFSLGLVLDIKDQAAVDFLGDDAGKDATEDAGKWFGQLYNPKHLVAVLWVIFEEEILARELDERSFARLCTNPVLSEARKAVVTAVTSFIHSPKVAAAMSSPLRTASTSTSPLVAARAVSPARRRLWRTRSSRIASMRPSRWPKLSGSGADILCRSFGHSRGSEEGSQSCWVSLGCTAINLGVYSVWVRSPVLNPTTAHNPYD